VKNGFDIVGMLCSAAIQGDFDSIQLTYTYLTFMSERQIWYTWCATRMYLRRIAVLSFLVIVV